MPFSSESFEFAASGADDGVLGGDEKNASQDQKDANEN